MSIIAAVNSKGLTSCQPGSLPLTLANASLSTTGTAIPDFHTISTPQWQWNNFFFRESNVFNPTVSNKTRIGKWRTTKTWYLRDQWAYVAEGATTPAVVAWTPMFSWWRTFHIQQCSPDAQFSISQNRWGPWRWGASIEEWKIWAGEQSIATATHVKEHQWWSWDIPNGWESTVQSDLQPGVTVADMLQTFDSYWVQNSFWWVKDYRPDIVQPWVISFLAVIEEEKSSSKNGRRNRRLGSKGKAQSGEAKVIEDLEEEKVV